ncbi:hypothetical protein [Plasticicumulans lactativorans]|uniref:hypothetical protein n=1 Tax=Plasticicumulans lactativorans TaxID=1133106 RepID=UPI0010499B3F|nr:hypothetical protein [Plasticicumulans lactativorans]
MGYRYGAQCFDDVHAQAESWCSGAAGNGISCNGCVDSGGAQVCTFHDIVSGSDVVLSASWSDCELTPFSPAIGAEYFAAGFGSIGLVLLVAWGCRQVLVSIFPRINQ